MSSEGDRNAGTLDTFERELRRGSRLLGEGRFEQAYTWAAEALALRPAHQLAQNLVGLVLYQQRRFLPALAIFEALVRKNPDVITLRMNAGLAALHAGEVERAVEHLRRAVDLDAGHHRAFNALAMAHLRRGEHHLAQAALLEANEESLAERLAEPRDEGTLRRLEMELRLLAEELPPSLEVDPCEGFAEVTALLPLDGWRQADLATSPAAAALPPGGVPTEELPVPELRKPTAPQAAAAPTLEPPPSTALPLSLPLAPAPEPEPPPSTELSLPLAPEPEPPSSTELSLPLAPAFAAAPEPPPSTERSLFSAEQVEVAVEDASIAAAAPLLPALGPEPPPAPQMTADPAGAARAPDRREVGPRRRLAERLNALSLPEARPHQHAIVRSGGLLIRLEATSRGVLLRPDRLVLERGALSFEPALRRRKGADAGAFTVLGNPFQVASGEGLLMLRGPEPLQVELLHLDDEALYLRESVLLAASAELQWENGRLPGADEELRLVHLHGSGFVALLSAGRPYSVSVSEAQGVRIKLGHLLGWAGSAVPELADRGMAGFGGTGVLLLQLAPPAREAEPPCPTT